MVIALISFSVALADSSIIIVTPVLIVVIAIPAIVTPSKAPVTDYLIAPPTSGITISFSISARRRCYSASASIVAYRTYSPPVTTPAILSSVAPVNSDISFTPASAIIDILSPATFKPLDISPNTEFKDLIYLEFNLPKSIFPPFSSISASKSSKSPASCAAFLNYLGYFATNPDTALLAFSCLLNSFVKAALAVLPFLIVEL
jgi:hypothetical protein